MKIRIALLLIAACLAGLFWSLGPNLYAIITHFTAAFMSKMFWLYIVVGLSMATIARTTYLRMRTMRDQLTRKSLSLYVSQLLSWVILGVAFFTSDWFMALCYFATLATIYLPTINYILRLPKEDRPA